MHLYFSGIASKQELNFLGQAQITKLLFDPCDYRKLYADITKYIKLFDASYNNQPQLMLDSGAYREFKGKFSIEIDEYKELAESHKFNIRVAKDVIGDPAQTFDNWKNHFSPAKTSISYMPVWEYGSDDKYLKHYLDDSPIIGIGGLVPKMREKNSQMLKDLKKLCKQHPGRFHLFGCNWLKVVNHLRDFLYSGDTSKFLDGGRYGHVIFTHTKYGTLSQAPAKFLGLQDLTRAERCIKSAEAMRDFCGEKIEKLAA